MFVLEAFCCCTVSSHPISTLEEKRCAASFVVTFNVVPLFLVAVFVVGVLKLSRELRAGYCCCIRVGLVAVGDTRFILLSCFRPLAVSTAAASPPPPPRLRIAIRWAPILLTYF